MDGSRSKSWGIHNHSQSGIRVVIVLTIRLQETIAESNHRTFPDRDFPRQFNLEVRDRLYEEASNTHILPSLPKFPNVLMRDPGLAKPFPNPQLFGI